MVAFGLMGMLVYPYLAHSLLSTSETIGLFLGTAMAAVGLNTNFAVFKGVGLKPFAVGMAGALVVGAVGMAMAVLLGRFVHL